jgi:hypothetical protein
VDFPESEASGAMAESLMEHGGIHSNDDRYFMASLVPIADKSVQTTSSRSELYDDLLKQNMRSPSMSGTVHGLAKTCQISLPHGVGDAQIAAKRRLSRQILTVEETFGRNGWLCELVERRDVLRAGFEAHHTSADLIAQAYPQFNALGSVSESPMEYDDDLFFSLMCFSEILRSFSANFWLSPIPTAPQMAAPRIHLLRNDRHPALLDLFLHRPKVRKKRRSSSS